jgi:hypothetical protein
LQVSPLKDPMSSYVAVTGTPSGESCCIFGLTPQEMRYLQVGYEAYRAISTRREFCVARHGAIRQETIRLFSHDFARCRVTSRKGFYIALANTPQVKSMISRSSGYYFQYPRNIQTKR